MELATYVPSDIRDGLPYSDLEQLMHFLGLAQHEAAALLLVSERTLARRRQDGRLTQAESDRFLRLRDLVEEAIEAFDGDEDAAVEWLRTGKTLLGGETPLHHADTEPGRRAVHAMLGTIQHGFAA